MVHYDILRVKHLPKELSDDEKEEFLQHFGATQVKIINYPKGKSIGFAKFESTEVARSVLFRLHQLPVLSSRLSVDFAECDIGAKQPKLQKVEEDDTQKKCFKNFILKLHSFNHSAGFHQPPPPHLRYDYPKANRPTINNISHVLATVPKFYIQVLHLMNRMNLPPPFVIETTPTNSLKPQTTVSSSKQSPKIHQSSQKVPSSSESELESDEDSKSKEVIPEKQFHPSKKAIKRPKFIKPNAKQVIPSKIMKTEEVFDRIDTPFQKKIEMKVSGESLQNVDKIDDVNISNKEVHIEERSKGTIITEEELKNNQIPLKDLGVLPVFKDYHPGIPSNRLYIKNIAKNVILEDLEFIFNRYKSEVLDKESQFNIRLMQEGRMKGQAFVTVDNIQIAQKALDETNGFILKDKPLVVVFGKSTSQKPRS